MRESCTDNRGQRYAYAFSLILAIFLLGDGLGIVAGAEVAQALAHPRRAFQLLQGVIGIYVLFSLVALFAVNGGTQLSLLGVEGSRRAIAAIMLAIVLPPALMLGMSFPITQRAVQDDPALVGRRVGLVQLCNILGNTVGAVVTGLVLLHWLGTGSAIAGSHGAQPGTRAAQTVNRYTGPHDDTRRGCGCSNDRAIAFPRERGINSAAMRPGADALSPGNCTDPRI